MEKEKLLEQVMERGEADGHCGEAVEPAARERRYCWCFFARDSSPGLAGQEPLTVGELRLGGEAELTLQAERGLPSGRK